MTMKKFAFLAFLTPFLTLSNAAWAFPDMIRHGYPACATCHASPDGGGVLTEYGRVLSEELLSTWSREGEGKFMYGAVRFPEWLSMNTDVRFIETYRKPSGGPSTSMFIFMQADLEAAARYKKLEAVASVGYQEVTPSEFPDFILSRRHYLTYRPTEKTSVRAGKFMAAYGIHTADHVLEIKRGLGWDEGSETYNVEGYYLGDGYELFATGILGRPDISIPDVEKGVALRGALLLDDSKKAGLSYYFGTNAAQSRHVFGPFAILGLSKRTVLMLEADFQKVSAAGTSTTGLASYARLSYEVVRGLHPFLTHEAGLNDLSAISSQNRYTYGLGLQWYPRPHFDFQLMYQIQTRTPGANANYAWFMMHSYL